MEKNGGGKCESNQAQPRFTADPPLGKLAKMLRMLGFDVLYSSRPVLSPAGCSEGRIRLTRSREVSGAGTLFIAGDDPAGQLKEVVRLMSIDRGQTRPFTRCIVCNCVLDAVKKKEVREQVPEYVWQTRNRFSKCGRCGRIYWSGSHTDHMARFVEEVFGLA